MKRTLFRCKFFGPLCLRYVHVSGVNGQWFYHKWCRSDSGAASFLSRAVQAIKDYAATGEWQVVTIPRVHIGLEAALAEAEKQHQLAAIEVPIEIPVAVTEGASQKMVRV